MGLDDFAAIDEEPQSAPEPAPVFDESEDDLFDFDELIETGEEIAKELTAELDAAVGSAGASAEAEPSRAKATAKSTASVAARAPAPTTPAPQAVPSPTTPAEDGTGEDELDGAEPNVAWVGQRLSMTPATVMMLAAVVVVNVLLVGFSWKSLKATESLVLDMGHEVIETARGLRQQAAQQTQVIAESKEPIVSTQVEGEETLEVVRELFEEGEFERGRRALYALMAVIDRLEPPSSREDVEARAMFLLADSYRLEADAIELAEAAR